MVSINELIRGSLIVINSTYKKDTLRSGPSAAVKQQIYPFHADDFPSYQFHAHRNKK